MLLYIASAGRFQDYRKNICSVGVDASYDRILVFFLQYWFFPLHFKGAKPLNGGSETQDINQSQQNGENTEEKKEKHEVGTKKKWVNVSKFTELTISNLKQLNHV